MDEENTKGWRHVITRRPTRRGLRKSARTIETKSVRHARTFIIDRFDSIKAVRRQALGWLLAVGLMISVSAFQLLGYQRSYSLPSPATGGTYAEGVVGPLETINPILARTPAELSATRLVFSSLLRYDSSGHLQNDIADTWRSEDSGRRYVVDLKTAMTWHDGKPMTADDVVFTVGLIKNQLVRSPLYSSWSQVKIVKLSATSVAFDLARPYAAFPHALTFGILPRHILGSLPPERIREADFNRAPVGSGPFQFVRLQVIDPNAGRLIVYLESNSRYIHGKPRLDRMQLHIFRDTEQIKKSFITQEINAATDMSSDQLSDITSQRSDALVYRTPILSGTYAFLRNDTPLFSDVRVRKAFVMATDRKAIIKSLHGYANLLSGPLTTDQLASMTSKNQEPFDQKQAGALLDQAGWVMQQDGRRTKDGQPMALRLVTAQSGDYPKVVTELKKQWEQIGATVTIDLVRPDDFQQKVILPRQYDALVYELELGADADVYAYWHESQADPRGLNLANYKSSVASDALSSAQLRLEPSIRTPKYELFVNTWIADSPAIALYQPQIHYVTSNNTDSIQFSAALVSRIDRYRLVELWTADTSWRYASP